MRGYIRQSVVLTGICVGLIAFAASPASAQVDRANVERVYVGVTPPVVGGVLATSGERPAVVAAQPLPSQVSSGAVAASAQAPVRGLALTGADVIGLVTIGLSAIALGTLLTRRGRRRSLPQT